MKRISSRKIRRAQSSQLVRRSRKPQPLAFSLARFATAVAVASALYAGVGTADAANRNWDPTQTASAFGGGPGTWDLLTQNWWNGASDVIWNNAGFDTAIFGGTPATVGTGLVNLGVPITVGGLTFNSSGYNLSGSALTFAGPTPSTIAVNGIGNRAVIASQVSGSNQLVKTGDGVLVLSNTANNFTGNTLINQGTLVITDPLQLGATGLISVNDFSSTNFTGGSLLLQGGLTGLNLGNYLSLAGRGIVYGNSGGTGALVSIGLNNTLSGNIAASNASETRILSNYGNLNVTGTVNVPTGNALAFAGNGNTIVTGLITGGNVSTDRLVKTSTNLASTLWLQNAANNYVNDTRLDAGNIRVSTNAALGLSTSTTAIDFNNGTLEVLTDSPDFNNRKVRVRDNTTSSVLFVSRALGGSGLNQTVAFNDLTMNLNTAITITGRDGYNVSFGGGTNNIGAGGNNNLTFTNNGNGTLTLNAPNIWNQTDTSGARTFTVQGTGDSIITGNIIASGNTHGFTKAGVGILTIQGTSSTFTGSATVSAGTLNISSIGALNATSTGRVVFSGGTLNYTGANETWANKVLLLNATNNILTNNGTGALVLSQNVGNNGTGTKTFFLGGSNAGVNDLQGIVINTTAGANVTKYGTGNWQISSPATNAATIGVANNAFAVTALTTAGQTVTTTSTAGLVVGQPISGGSIPAGTVISQIISSTQFAISQSTTVPATVILGTVTGATASVSIASNTTGNVLTTTSATGTANLVVGQPIVGPGLTAGAGWYISAINSANTFTVSNTTGAAALVANAATGSATPGLSNNFGGNLTIGGGTVTLNPTSATARVMNNGSGVIFATDPVTGNGTAGGTLVYKGNGASSETAGILTPTAGVGRIQITPGTSGNVFTFGSVGTRSAGAILNFVPGTGTGIQFMVAPAAAASSNGALGGYAYITDPTTGSIDFAATPVANTNITALNAATALPTTVGSATTNYLVSGGLTTTTAAVAANTIRLSGGSLALGGALTITSASATSLGGILHDNTGGAAAINGSTITTSVANQELVITTGGANPENALTIGSVLANGTGPVTKAGTGTLILTGANTFTGALNIDEGTVRPSGTAATLGAPAAATVSVIRQAGTLDLNASGVATNPAYTGGASLPIVVSAPINGAGSITTTAAGAQAIQLGTAASTGSGVFSGIISDGAGQVTVIRNGASGSQALTGLNTYTGPTVLSGGATLQATSLANGGVASSIGASSSAASNLVFNGGTLQYTGSNATIFQAAQTPSISINRQFTLAGNGTIDSSGQFGNNVLGTGTQNNAALVFNSNADVSFAGAATARLLTLTGNSIGDNELDAHLINNGAGALSLTKAGASLWILNPSTSNTYSGATTISAGALQVAPQGAAIQGLSANSNLVLNGGVLQTTGSFTMALGTTAGTVQFGTSGGGFSAGSSKLTVNLGGGTPLVLGGAAPLAGSTIILSSTTAQADVELQNAINLNAGARTIQVDDNANSTFDFAYASGVISGATGSSLNKTGGGNLILGAANTYLGNTTVSAGNIIVQSIGASGATATSIGTNVSGGALNIGNAGTGAGVLYVGAGETTTRTINLNGSTGGATIDSSGSGALILTTVANFVGGAKTLTLRGTNTDANEVQSVLADNGGILSVTKSDGGNWVLSGSNTFTGNLTIGGGLLGIASNANLGANAAGNVVFSNGGIYALGAPLTITRAVQIAANTAATFTGAFPITVSSLITGVAGNPWTINNTIPQTVGNLTISGNFASAEAATQARAFIIQGTGNTILSGILQSTGATNGGVGLTINTADSATTTVTGASPNLLSGPSEIRQGTLILDKVGALGISTGTLALNGGVLQSTSTANTTGANALPMAVTLGGSAAIISGSGGITFTNTLTNSAGNRILQNDITGPASLTLGAVNLSGDSTSRTLNLSGSGTTNITGVIANGSTSTAGNLTYLGSGALVLTGANTFGGVTTLSGGATTVTGAAGTLATSSGIVVNQASLTLDNTTTALSNRLGSKPLTLNGSTFSLLGGSGAVSEGTVSASITTTAGSATATVGSATGLSVGQAIFGNPNIPNGTTITAISGTTLTLSTGTGVTAGTSIASNLASPLTIGTGGSTFTSTLNGGTNSTTFSNLVTTAAGSSVNFTGGVGVTGNKVLFLTAPTLTPGTTGILARATVNGADFATYDTTNGITAFTGYTTPADVNTSAATDTLKVTGSTTTTGFSAVKTINALALNGNGLTVSNNANAGVVLTLTSGGILNTGGANTLSARIALGAEGALHVGAGSALTVGGFFTGGSGLTKNLTGSLTFTSPQFYTGATTLNGGTTTLSGGSNTIFPGQTLVVSPGATLDLNGNNQYVNAFGAGNNPGTGGTVTSATPALFSNNGNVAYGGGITGAISLNKTGSSTLTAESPLTYTGTTTITGGGLTLRDNATLLNTTAININFSTLTLDSNANLQIGNNNRVSDTAPITSRGGTITYNARFGANGSETFGALIVGEGATTINVSANNNANSNIPNLSADVTFASLSRTAGSTINLASNQGLAVSGNANRIFFTSAPTPLANGMLGAWAIANATDFATYDPTLGVGAFGYGEFKGYDATFAPGNVTQFVNNATPTIQTLSGTTVTGALRLGGVSNNDIAFTTGSDVLNLQTGGLLRSNQAAATSIGTTAVRGVLTAGGTATSGNTELVIYSANTTTTASAATAVTTTDANANIIAVPSAAGLVPGMTVTGTNIPAGTYIVSVDTVNNKITVSQAATAASSTNTLTYGTANMIVNSVIANSGNGTSTVSLVKSGTGTLNLSANNTYTGGTTFNQGTVNLIGSGVVIPAGGITLSGATLVMNTNAGQIAASNAVTLNDSSTLTLVGNNTLDSLTFNNSGGTGTPTVNSGGILTLTSATPFAVTTNNVATVATVAGTVNLTPGVKTLNIGAIQVGGQTVSAINAAMNISAVVNGIGTSIVKTGGGLLQLSGQNTFTGGIDLQAGGLIVGAGSSPTTGGAGLTSGPFGSGPITAAAGTNFVATGTAAFGNDVTFAGTPTFDSTANTVWQLTLNGQLNGLANGASTIQVSNPFLTVALLGKIPNIGSITSFNKTGPGALIFNSTGYTGDFNASALGNQAQVQLLNDGDGTGSVQTITLGNVVFDTGIVPNIIVGRAGGTLPLPAAVNKKLATTSVSNLGLGITLANNNGYGLVASDNITVSSGANYSVATATGSNVVQGLELTGKVTAPSGFNKIGGGTLVLSNTTNVIGAPINVTQGVISISSLSQLGGATVALNPSTGTSTLRVTDNITGSVPIQFTNTANTRAIEVIGGKTLQLNSAFDLNGTTGVSAGLTKADAGTLVLNANNSAWTGALTISQGAVRLTNAGGLGTTAGSTTVGASGAALQIAGGISTAEPLNLTGSGILSGGALQATGAGAIETGAIALTGATFIGADSGATLSITGGISGAQALTFVGAGNISLATTALGAVTSVTKIGTGTTTLGVASPLFVGNLTVNNGTFVASAALGATGTITVNPSGTFTVDNTSSPTARLAGRPVALSGGTLNYNTNSSSAFSETAGVLTLSSGSSVINMSNTGTALTTLSFASVTQNGNSTVNITGLNPATNQLKFSTTVPTLTPATTGILSRFTINGSDFATYGTNGIAAFTGYATATNILSASTTQTFKATPSTLNSLTGNQTLNALTLDSVNSTATVGGLGGLNPATLTLTSNAILVKSSGTGTSSTLNVPIIALSGEGIVHVQAGQTLNVNSAFSGTGGFTKALPGALNFNTQQFVSSTTSINAGTVKLASGVTNTLLYNNGLLVNVGGTLDLNGGNQFVAGLATQGGGAGTDLGGGTVTNTSGTQAIFTINGNTNFGGVIAGNIYLNKTGTGALNLQAQQTYTGPTLLSGGNTTLADGGALPNTTQPIDIRFATLTVNDGGLIPMTNRINDNAPITLTGGTIAFTGRAQAASSETLGSLTLAGGLNTFTTNSGGTGINSLDVTIASLNRTDSSATLRMNATGQLGSSARLFITAAPTLTNNIIGPWAVVDRELASYDSTYGVGALNGNGFAGYSGSGLNSGATGTDNVRFTATGTTTLLGNTKVGTLTFGQQAANTIVNLGGNTLTVQGGAILFSQNTDNTDFSITNGSITSGTLNNASDLFLHHLNFGNTNRTVTIGAPIVNNGTGAVRVIFSSGQNETAGANSTTLNGVSTYTGGTVINNGNIVLGATGALGTGGITVDAGILTQTAGGVIPSQALTQNGGSTVILAGNNSLTNVNFNNNGGAAPTLNPTGVLTVTGGISALTSNAGTISNITGGTVDLNGNNSFPISVGATLVNGADIAPWQAGLNIVSTIQNGGITKTGAGLLGLSGQSTFTGGVNITSGGLVLGASSTPSTYSGVAGVPTVVTSGPLGTGTLTLANSTSVVASVASTVSNNVTILGDTVFNGTNAITFNGITTLPSVWNATVTAPQMSVIIADATPSGSGDVINKSGLGSLTVGNYAGTIMATGGLIFTGDGNTLGTPENVSLGGDLSLTGDLAITVTRSGSAPNGRNKTLQKVNLTNNGSILSISNQNGYGLEFTGNTVFTAASHLAVGVATASNVVQGLTLSGVVSDMGGFSLVKSGAGTLALTNAGNTFGGSGDTIDVLNGILSASSNGALGNLTNTVTLDVDGSTGVGFRATGTFNSARTFILNQANNAFEVTVGNILTLTAPFSLSANTNTLSKNDNGVLALSGNNSAWTGAITINSGAIEALSNTALGSGTITVAGPVGAALQLGGGATVSNPLTISATTSTGINTGGVIESVSGVNTFAGAITQTSGAAITIGADAGSTLNLTGGVNSQGGNSITFGGAGNVNIKTTGLNNGSTFNKIGSGVLTVAVANPNLAAATAINLSAGTTVLNGTGTLGPVGAATGALTVDVGSTLTIDNTNAAGGNVNNRFGTTRPITFRGGNFNLLGNDSAITTETFATPTMSRGLSVITAIAPAGGQANLVFTGSSVSVGFASAQNNSTGPTGASVLFRGTNLGNASANGVASIKDTGVTNGFFFNGQSGATGTTTKGILPWALIDSTETGVGTSFATGDGTTFTIANLRPLAASEYGTANTVTANQNVLLNGGTTTTIAAAVAPNSLTIDASANLNINPGILVNISSGGILARAGTSSSISGGVLNQTSGFSPLNFWTVGDLTVSSTINGGNGVANGAVSFVKAGASTLTLSSPTSTIAGLSGMSVNSMSGLLSLNQGTLKLNGGKNTILANNFFVLNGGTLDLNGNSQQVLSLFTDGAVNGAGGTVTSSNGFGNLVINQDNAARNWAGAITGTVSLTRSGQNTLTVYSPQTYFGPTLLNGGTTALRDAAALSATSSIDLNFATLTIDNNGGTIDMTDRVNDAAPVTLRGGTITFQGRALTASTETLGDVTIAPGLAQISSVVGGGTGVNSADLTLTSLTRQAGGTVNFTAATGGLIGSSSRILIPAINGASTATAFGGLTNGIIGGWATIGTSDFATYVPGLGVAALGTAGAPQYATATVLSATTLATDNVKLNTGVSNLTLDTTVNSVATSNVAVGAINIAAGKTLTIASGGLLSFTNTSWNVGSVLNQGAITSGGPELFIYTQGSGIPTFNAVITGSNTVVKSGVNTATFAATNNYTGGTTVNQGTLNVATTGTIPLASNPSRGLVINNAIVTLNAPGSINAGNIATVNGGGTLNLFGNNTLQGLVFNNTGGTSNPVVNTYSTLSTLVTSGSTGSGVLTIGGNGIVATSSNIGTISQLSGRVDFGSSPNTINVDTINANGVNDIAPLQAAFGLQGVVGSSGGITKTGQGVLQFGGQNVFTGPFTVATGGIKNGTNTTNAGSRFSALTLNSGTRYDLNGASTTWGSLSGSGTVFNSGGIAANGGTAATLSVGYDNTSTTFSGQFARFNDANPSYTALTKVGTGTMTLTGTQVVTSGSTGAVTANQGVLAFKDTGAWFTGTTASATNAAIAGTFTVNTGGTLALDNTGSASINNRLGLNATGTLNLQGGTFTINAGSAASTPATEQITTFNVVNGGGRVDLTADATNPVTLTITNLNTANGNGTAVFSGIDGSVAGLNGKASIVITNANLIGSQGGGANGSTNMSVRHDILGDATIGGLGTGFLVKDSVSGTYRALASNELSAVLSPSTGTQNVGLSTTQAITANSVANTLTISGTGIVNSGLDAATFGNYGPNGGLLTLSLSQAAASLTLANATGTINVGAFGSTAVGTTPFVHVIAGGTLNVNSAFAVNGTVGLAKADDGTLNLNKQAYYTGATTVNGGTLNLNSGIDNTIAVVPGATTPTVSTLNLNGTTAVVDLKNTNQVIGALSSINPLPGQGGTVTNTGNVVKLLTSTGGGTFGGTIGGNLAFTRAGNSTTLLTNANTYLGATTIRGGTLQLRDSGSILNTASITANFGTLLVDNYGLNTSATPGLRVSPTTQINLLGGVVTLNGAGSVDNTMTINNLAATGGSNTVNVTPQLAEGSTALITIGNLTRNAANHTTVNFNGFTTNNSFVLQGNTNGSSTTAGQGLNANGNIILNQVNGVAGPVSYVATGTTTAGSATVTVATTAGLAVGMAVTGTGIPAGATIATITNGTTLTLNTGTGVTAQTNVALNFNTGLTNNLIGGWAVADGSTFATYITGRGVAVMGQTTAGVITPGFDGVDFSAATTAIQNINDSAARTLATGAHVANSWRSAASSAQTITLSTGATLSLGVGMITNGNTTITIQGTDATNTLTSPNSDLYFFVNQNTTSVNTKITGAISLIKSGGSVLSLGSSTTAANNDYTGGTFVQAGTLTLNGAVGSVIIPGDLTVNNAAVTMNATAPGQIAATSNLFINGGGTITLANYAAAASQSVNSLTFDNQGGTGNPTLALGTPTAASTFIISGANAITSNNDSLATTPVITTGAATLATLQFSNASPVITTSGSSPNSLNIQANITSVGANGLSKSGPGSLTLSGANTFTTGFNLNQGSLIFGASSTGTAPSVTNGPVGTGTLTIAGGTILSDGTIRTIGNATTINGDFAFGGVTSANNVILTGPMSLGGSTRTVTVTSPAVTAAINALINTTVTTGSNGLVKAGAGTLTIGVAQTDLAFGGTGTTAGILVSEGILKNGIANALPNSSLLTINAGAGFDLNAFDQTSKQIAGAGFITNSGAVKTLTIGGTSATDTTTPNTVNSVFAGGIVAATPANLLLTKVGLGTLTLSGSGVSSYAGNTTIVAGSLIGGATNAFSPNSPVIVGNATTTTAGLTARLDTGAFDQTIGGLTASTNTAAGTAVINVPTGNTLTVLGNVTLGSNVGLTDVTNVNFTGGGNFTVTKDGGVFQVGGATGLNTNTVNADLSTVANFTVNLGTTGVFRVGSNNGAAGSATDGLATLTLGTNNTITAGTLNIGENTSESTAQTLKLGSGTNVLNVNTLNASTNSGRGRGVLNFATTTGTLTVRAVDGVSRAAFNVINGVSGTGADLIGTVNLAGHNSDLLLSTLTLAARSAGNAGNGNATSTFTFDTGILDVTTIVASSRTLTNTNGLMTSTINIGGGTANIGTLNLATNSAAAGTATGGATATLNVTGGNVTIGAVNLANVSGNALNKATATLALTGGTVTVNGNIARGTATGTEATTLTLNGSTLDLTGHNIGASGSLIQTVNLQSGTLKNVGEINAGAILSKTGLGTLVLDGVNAYTGQTNVTAGIVDIHSDTALGGTTSGTVVSAGATLQIENNVNVGAEPLTLNGGNAAGQTGAFVNLSGTNTFGGAVTVAASSSISALPGSTLNLTGGIVKSGTTATLTGGGNINISGVGISGSVANSDLVVNGGTKVKVTAASNYTGPTTVTGAGSSLEVGGVSGMISGTTQVNITAGGTVLLSGGSERINNVPLTLNVGTLAFGGSLSSVTETFSTLTLGGNAVIDFGNGDSNKFTFSGLSLGSSTLNIYNWSGNAYFLGDTTDNGLATQDHLVFSSSVSANNLSQINFFSGSDSSSPFLGSGMQVQFGGAFEIVPVPEPSSAALLGAVGILGLLGYRRRRLNGAAHRD